MRYAEALQRTQTQYEWQVQAGRFFPAPSLNSSASLLLLIFWLLISPDLPNTTFEWSRWLIVVAIAGSSVWAVLICRSPGVLGSIGVGLNSGLSLILMTNFVLLHDHRQFKRLVLRSDIDDKTPKVSDDSIKPRDKLQASHQVTQLVWQSIPQSLLSRLAWILDLLTSPRAQHWTWSSDGAKSELPKVLPQSPARTGCLGRYLSHFLIDYHVVDLIKCAMISDPYFLSGDHAHPPPAYLAPYLPSAWLVYIYRMLLGAAGIFIAQDLLFASARLIFVNILGSDLGGLNGLPVAFPPLWGSLWAVPHKGLRGFWSETWHQLFRRHFGSVGHAAGSCLVPGNISASRKSRIMVRVVIGFLLSGMLHAFASFTLLGPTKPWKPLLFFALQPLGMALQSLLLPSGDPRSSHLTQAKHVLLTLVWLGSTVCLLIDDMSSGGTWLFEPVPISLIRGMGLVGQDDRFWCW